MQHGELGRWMERIRNDGGLVSGEINYSKGKAIVQEYEAVFCHYFFKYIVIHTWHKHSTSIVWACVPQLPGSLN